MDELNKMTEILTQLGFNKYEAQLLTYLIYLGETSALKLSELSGVPSSKTYPILKNLAREGLVIEKPGRPTIYVSIPPDEIIHRILINERKKYEERIRRIQEIKSQVLEIASKIYLKGKSNKKRSPLIRIIKVGSVSEEETRKIYLAAKKEILILTQAFEYYPRVRESLIKALRKKIDIKIIFKKPDKLNPQQRKIQQKIINMIQKDSANKIKIRFSKEVPLRGCIIDPTDEGKAIFLVEEKEVPFEYREAAVTENKGLLRSLGLMFKLIWNESKE